MPSDDDNIDTGTNNSVPTPITPSVLPDSANPETSTPAIAYPAAAPAVQDPARPDIRKKFGTIPLIIAAIALILGGSAAAYIATVASNDYEGLLQKAISNSALESKRKFEGKIIYESTDENAKVKAVNVDFDGESDSTTNQFAAKFEINASGAKLPVELRSFDKSIFFKIGDLGSVKGLAQTAAPEYAPIVDAVNKKIANQWIEADETLLKQAKADCTVNTSFSLTKEDIELLQSRYKKVPFANIKNTSDDTVNGRAATKYEIDIDDNKSAEYAKGLEELSVLKKLKQCNMGDTEDSLEDTLADGDSTPITIWVDNSSKQVAKIAGKTTKQDEEKEKIKASFEITMQYGQASVSKPEGAKPFMEVFGELTQIFGQGTLSSPSSRQNPSQLGAPPRSVSPECAKAIQDYANSNGTTRLPAGCM